MKKGTIKLDICIPTTGESCLFQCLDRVIRYTPRPYNLRLWYNVLDEFDGAFLKRMREYTDDVIVCHKGYGSTEESFFHQMTCEAEFLIGMSSDTNVKEDYFERLMLPMRNNDRVGYVGHRCGGDNGDVPDKLSVIRKKMIDDVGATSPLCKVYGHASVEHTWRMIRERWVVMVIPDLVYEDFENNKGKKIDKRVKPYMARSDEALVRLYKNAYKDFNWWMNEY